MLQEGLEHDQITVNQICTKATTRIMNRFIHEPMESLLKG